MTIFTKEQVQQALERIKAEDTFCEDLGMGLDELIENYLSISKEDYILLANAMIEELKSRIEKGLVQYES